MNIERQLGNGNWMTVSSTNEPDRTDEFIGLAAEYQKTSPDAVRALLQTGREISYGSNWHSQLRIKPAPVAPLSVDPRPVMSCRSCGQTGHRGEYPFSTNPASGRCDDCA